MLCHDTVGDKMAGPGIRYVNIAQQLQKVAAAKLGVFSENENGPRKDGLVQVSKSGDGYKKIFDRYDVLFAQWLSGEMLQYARQTGKTIVFDLYAPVPIEYLASISFSSAELTSDKDIEFSGIIETYSNYLAQGDFFVCSNERQRDFWLGYSLANGLVKPTNFSKQDLLKRFAIGPMGISSQPPKRTDLKLRSALNIKPDDYVLLWTGGIWDWFDAQVIIRAVDKLANPKIKLVFLGTKHPNEIYKEEMSESILARQLVDKLGLLDKSVYFKDGWVPYNERAAYFLDADAAIYADKESLEARFSHRTRVLDHIWTGLPTICNSGDYMAEVIEKYGFGLVVRDRTADAFVAAINDLSKNQKLIADIKKNISRNKHLFTWENTLAPLVEFVGELKNGSSQTTKPALVNPLATKIKLRRRVRRAAKMLIKGQ